MERIDLNRHQGVSRRQVLLGGAAALSWAALGSRQAKAFPLGLPLGLQLYSVRDQLKADFDGTLRKVGALGYREVEGAGWLGRSAAQVKAGLDAAGLRCPSAHYNLKELQTDAQIDALVAFHHGIGAEWIICPFPGFRDPAHAIDPSSKVGVTFEQAVRAITLDDLRYTAGELNRIGKRVVAGGLRFGYHNHTMEFVEHGGVLPFREMARLTDPSLVSFELDTGWAWVANGNPVALLHEFAPRIAMLHIKDFKAGKLPATAADPPPAAELGRGNVPLREIVDAASKQYVRHIFVEQEHFNMPPDESLRVDMEFARSLK